MAVKAIKNQKSKVKAINIEYKSMGFTQIEYELDMIESKINKISISISSVLKQANELRLLNISIKGTE